MGRPSLREQRRAGIARALVQTLATHGRAGATIAAVARAAGIAPGLVHHYFDGKQDLYEAAIRELVTGFRRRIDSVAADDPLESYLTAALALDARSDVAAARAWVGVFAESLGDPTLFARMRRVMDGEVAYVEARARGALSTQAASAVVAFVVGALVFGAFAPRRTAGFAAPSLRTLVRALRVTLLPFVLVAALGGRARAQTAAAGAGTSRVDLTWDAPSPCPSGDELRAQVRSLIAGAADSGPSAQARGQVERAAKGRWHLHLRLAVDGHEDTRDLDAASCTDLATATATLVAIAVSPGETAATAASAAPASGPAGPAGPGSPAPRAGPAGPAGSAGPAGPAAPADSTGQRDPRFAVAALLGGSTGAVGDPAFALGASAAYLTPRTRWELGVLWSPLRAVDSGGIGGVFSLGVVEARACYTFPLRLRFASRATVGPCVNAEGGYLYARGEGSDLALEAAKTRGWAGVGAGGLLTVGGPVLAFRLQLEAVVPLASTHFVVDGAGEVETPWPIVPRALIGGEVHFP